MYSRCRYAFAESHPKMVVQARGFGARGRDLMRLSQAGHALLTDISQNPKPGNERVYGFR